jgi:hypothetical protein
MESFIRKNPLEKSYLLERSLLIWKEYSESEMVICVQVPLTCYRLNKKEK